MVATGVVGLVLLAEHGGRGGGRGVGVVATGVAGVATGVVGVVVGVHLPPAHHYILCPLRCPQIVPSAPPRPYM